MNYKSFLTDTWTRFSQLFNKFVKKTFVGTRAEWDLLSAAEKKEYDLADFTDDTASGVPIISDTVTDGDMNAVTSNAVANHLVIDTINLGTITVEANANYTILLSDYDIDTHNKPWVAFVYNRSTWSEFLLFGDGNNILILRNLEASSVTGIVVIAVLHYGA